MENVIKHFPSEVIYQDKFFDESYKITFLQDSYVTVYREYHTAPSFECPNTPKLDQTSTFKGTYNILRDDSDKTIVRITLNKESTVAMGENSTIVMNEQNKDVNITFDLIERKKWRKGVTFSTEQSIFLHFKEVSDRETLKYEIENLTPLGISEQEIINAAYKYNNDTKLFLIEKFPALNLQKHAKYINEKLFGNSNNYYDLQRIYLELAKSHGKVETACENLSQMFKEIRALLSKHSNHDLELAFQIYNVKAPYVLQTANDYYDYFFRHDLYKEQAQSLIKNYHYQRNQIDYDKLAEKKGDLKLYLLETNPDLTFKRELDKLKTDGYKNDKKNHEIMKLLLSLSSSNIHRSYEDIKFFFKIHYNEKLSHDFDLMRGIVEPFKNGYNLYIKNKSDPARTIFDTQKPGYLDKYGDLVPLDNLKRAACYYISKRFNNEGTFYDQHYIDFSEFEKCMQNFSLYITTKEIVMSELDMLNLFSMVSDCQCPPERLYEFYQNKTLYQEKCFSIEKEYPQLKDHYYILHSLFRRNGNVPLTLMDLGIDSKIVFKDDIQYFQKISGLENYSPDLILKALFEFERVGIENNRENIIFYLKFFADETKSTAFNILFSEKNQTNNYVELYNLMEKHNWNAEWGLLYRESPTIYEAFKDDNQVDIQTLNYFTNICEGNLERIKELVSKKD